MLNFQKLLGESPKSAKLRIHLTFTKGFASGTETPQTIHWFIITLPSAFKTRFATCALVPRNAFCMTSNFKAQHHCIIIYLWAV